MKKKKAKLKIKETLSSTSLHQQVVRVFLLYGEISCRIFTTAHVLRQVGNSLRVASCSVYASYRTRKVELFLHVADESGLDSHDTSFFYPFAELGPAAESRNTIWANIITNIMSS